MGKRDLTKAEKHARKLIPFSKDWKLVKFEGAWPFISHIVHRQPDGSLHIWSSRSHRKGRGDRLNHQPTDGLGWWISILFMIGSACFALGSLAGLTPELFGPLFKKVETVNAVFFTGSLFFTSAAYLQLLEAANATRREAQARGEEPGDSFCWFGWKPWQIGWLSAAIQFAGTLLFNVNTLDAMLPGLNWLQQDLLIWTPDIIGCVCFLAASWLAVLECCHGIVFWKMQGLSWWIVMINMLGSIAFGLSGIFAIVLPRTKDVLDLQAVNLWTCAGALCFFFGAYLLFPEMKIKQVTTN